MVIDETCSVLASLNKTAVWSPCLMYKAQWDVE